MSAHDCNQGDRFDRIEDKLDTLIELQVTNARVEEQLAGLVKAANDHEARLRAVEKACGINTIFTKSTLKVILVVLGAAGTAIGGGLVGYYLGG